MRIYAKLILTANLILFCGGWLHADPLSAAEQVQLQHLEDQIHKALDEMAINLNPYVEKDKEERFDQILKAGTLHEASVDIQDLVMSYLQISKTRFKVETVGEFDVPFIDPIKDGVWLNRIAHELQSDGVQFGVAPDLMTASVFGLCSREPRRIVMAIPPFPGSLSDILSHELFHDLLISRAGQLQPCHLQRGEIQRSPTADKAWTQFYQKFDFSEVGAFAESIYRLGKGMREYPQFADSVFHIYSIKKSAKYLYEFTSSLEKALAGFRWLRWGSLPLEMFVTQEEGQTSYGFVVMSSMGSRLVFRDFFSAKELQGSELTWFKRKDEDYSRGVFTNIGKRELRLISGRLNQLREIYADLRAKVRRFRQLEKQAMIAATDHPRLWVQEANDRWTILRGQELPTYKIEDAHESLLNCAEILK